MNTLPSPVATSSCGERALPRLDLLGGGKQASGSLRQLGRPARVAERRAGNPTRVVEDDSGLDLRGDLGEVGESLLGVHGRRSIGILRGDASQKTGSGAEVLC